MIITILSDLSSWINQYIPQLISRLSTCGHSVLHIHNVKDMSEGDIAFFLGCGQLVPANMLALNSHNLVVHESDLPRGKGWSPLTWQILDGINSIPIVLFEAVATVDSGDIYLRDTIQLTGYELIDEIREIQGLMTIRLCVEFVDKYPGILNEGKAQQGESSYYSRRTPKDSRLDLNRTLREQFNLLRTVDNERYPAYFELSGHKYVLRIERE